MNRQTVDNKINQVIELKKQKKQIEDAIALIVDSLKDEMDKNGLEELRGDKLYCYYKDVCKTVADVDKLKRDDLYTKYSKQSEYKMFDYKYKAIK